MKVRRPRHATVIAYLALALAMSGTAYAANGGAVLLGKKNVETAATTISTPGGPALALATSPKTAPLAVSSSRLVTRFNADLLDGVHAKDFARVSASTGLIVGAGYLVDYDKNGTFDFAEASATCPTGTVLTGGGGYAAGDNDYLWFSGPTGVRTWTVDVDTLDASKVEAYAMCYNPTGRPVTGAVAPQSLPATPAARRK